jgi:hypothetical protein
MQSGRVRQLTVGAFGLGVAMQILALLYAWSYPVPTIPGGWCGSGADHSGYAINDRLFVVTCAAFVAGAIVVAAGTAIPERGWARVGTALTTSLWSLLFFGLTWVITTAKLGCWGS